MQCCYHKGEGKYGNNYFQSTSHTHHSHPPLLTKGIAFLMPFIYGVNIFRSINSVQY